MTIIEIWNSGERDFIQINLVTGIDSITIAEHLKQAQLDGLISGFPSEILPKELRVDI